MKLTAIQALELGWSIIPVKCDKRPYIDWRKYQSLKPDKEMLSQWHKKFSPPAWAVVTGTISGIFVLDFDGKEGARTMEAFGFDPHVQTGSGGYHLYLVHPGFQVKTLNSRSKRELGSRYPGLDIRADGGYAVFAGKNDAGTYNWLREPVPEFISILPSEMRTFLGLEKRNELDEFGDVPTPAENLLDEAVDQARTDGRNNAGFLLACQLRDNGYIYDRAIDVMKDYQSKVPEVNAKGQYEPYTLEEAMATLKQAYQATITIVRSGSGNCEADYQDKVSFKPWPEPLAPEAFHGLAGDFVSTVEPHTEADPVALLMTFLTAFGNVTGRKAHFVAEADKHYMNLFTVQVGTTAKGRKGSALGQVLKVFQSVDPTWSSNRLQSGLSSGEGLIWAVRDPIEKAEPMREKKEIVGYQSVVIDQGIDDKRLLIIESEFASPLRVLGREGNTLSATIRNAWDTGNLRVLTKNSAAVSTDAHISIIGHVTKQELLRYLEGTEAGNGFGNRFLWTCVKRSKVLPEGGRLEDKDLEPLVQHLREAVNYAMDVEEMRRDENARALWYEVYEELSEGKPGLLGAMTARGEAQVMRLACIYALLDQSDVVGLEHLKAALAVWKCCEDSAKFIFGDALGNPVADEILKVLRERPEGITRTEISNHFGRHKSTIEISRALAVLMERGLAHSKKDDCAKEGKPTERWFRSMRPNSKETPLFTVQRKRNTPPDAKVISHNSLVSQVESEKTKQQESRRPVVYACSPENGDLS